MPRQMGNVRILISARLLLDLEKADAIFKEQGLKEYTDYMLCRGKYEKDFNPELGGRELKKGALWEFAQAILALNKPGQDPVVELGIVCKDEANTAVPIFRNLVANDVKGVYAEWRVATAGKKLALPHLKAFDTDLLLTRNAEDVQLAVDNGIAAAVINVPPQGTEYSRPQDSALHIWVDGDAVAVGSSSEVIYKRDGLEKYIQAEAENFDKEMEEGPFTRFLAKVSAINAAFPADEPPFKLTLLTARSNGAIAHVIRATEKMGIRFNEGMYFVGHTPKAGVLKATKPDIFFDDQQAHLEESKLYCPTGLVAYPAGSAMDLFLKEKAAITEKQAPAEKTVPVKQAASRNNHPRQ